MIAEVLRQSHRAVPDPVTTGGSRVGVLVAGLRVSVLNPRSTGCDVVAGIPVSQAEGLG